MTPGARLPGRAMACRAGVLASLILALAAAGLAGCSSGSTRTQLDPYNFEGNWEATLTVVSTTGSFVDADCAPSAVGDQSRATFAISQDDDSIAITVIPAGEGLSYRLTGRVSENSFDATGELATTCDGPLRFGIDGEKIDDDAMSGEITGTRSGLTGTIVFSATRS